MVDECEWDKKYSMIYDSKKMKKNYKTQKKKGKN